MGYFLLVLLDYQQFLIVTAGSVSRKLPWWMGRCIGRIGRCWRKKL